MAIGAFREAYLRIHQVMDRGKLDRDLWDIRPGKIFSGTYPPEGEESPAWLVPLRRQLVALSSPLPLFWKKLAHISSSRP
ncbi:hypothetical protein ACFY4I_27420 [Streptomyces scabiei]|uniref:hypothetical protein n=1 Tax=Streptomyces scabiei TaxID=1930 RepID=UPI0036B9C159